ncbi:MAG: carbohydrate ABC transporter permease [Devosia sp.]|jgi:multiple sugar transport system permease protein|uniref:carbohydrate ABC transporter permease n=1 Tax=Devosia sp. XGJD_8 TaxID=3391187 RepID=UPI001D4470A4|nr:carbohydrate ABC transporter permease [Alphaproteobacteria bacterium]MBU1562441.1 carbohydrate ABC transporter permease [Alphaproteobacteria bacterium]MBU2304094.1 carbohydrate ABC transporter permease [Alphaproteobacteria bacterium]MBU2369156.1 carbohydrate ABC transporter permease [Alphaproteobacteria bacterium]
MTTLRIPRGAVLPLLFAGILALGVLLPLLMMVTISLNPNEQDIMVSMGSIRSFIPQVFSLENYVQVWTDPVHPFPRYLWNTLLITGSTLLLSILFNSMAAFVLAQGTLKVRKLVMILILATLAVPGESLVLPQLMLASWAGLIDSYQVQIIPGVANAMSIFLFYQFFSRLPKELIEAARIDGFSFFQIYRYVAMPLSKPVISAIAVLQFLEIWNAYLWPVMVTRGPEYRPLSVAMSAYFGTNQAAWGNIMAFAVSMAIPVILFFLIMQRQFIASVMSSGVKG